MTVPHPDGQGDAPNATLQVTPPFAGSSLTVALNVATDLTGIRAESGATETAIAGTVIAALPDLAVLAREVAVTVTPRLLRGAPGGALYVTEVVVALLRVPAPDVGDIAQATPAALGSYWVIAVSACEVPAGTVAVTGDTETTIAGTVRVA